MEAGGEEAGGEEAGGGEEHEIGAAPIFLLQNPQERKKNFDIILK